MLLELNITMLNVVMEREQRLLSSPTVYERLEIVAQRTRKRVSEIRETVRGKKEEFNVKQYFRLRFHKEPRVIDQLLADSIEEEYYLLHPEFKTIQELVDYHDLHEYDT